MRSSNEAGIAPRIVMEVENVAVIKPLVKFDLGISIIRLRAVAEEVVCGELHALRIRYSRPVREVGLVYQKSDTMPCALTELIRLFDQAQHKSV